MEGAAFGCVGLFTICVTYWLPIALIIILGGSIGLFKDRKHKGIITLISIWTLLIGVCMILNNVRLEYFPKPTPTPHPIYGIDDEAVEPFLLAMNKTDRLALGFSPISKEVSVKIIEYNDTSVEVFFHIGPDSPWGARTNWSVIFKMVEGEYKWARESEIYADPTGFGNIYLWYFTDLISPRNYYGTSEQMPQNTLVVDYRGEDNRLIKEHLTLDDVRPILREWDEIWETLEVDE